MKRRHFLGLASLLTLATPSWATTTRQPTPAETEGPFYPVKPIPLQADLIRTAAGLQGKIMQLGGRVLNAQGKPLTNIKVEIWQCDGQGLYDHPRQTGLERLDPHFAGSGATLTDAQGNYRFRTLYPVPYTGRPPHIHVKLWQGERELLTTQLYLRGQTGNEWFGSERERLQIAPQADARGVLMAGFEFVV